MLPWRWVARVRRWPWRRVAMVQRWPWLLIARVSIARVRRCPWRGRTIGVHWMMHRAGTWMSQVAAAIDIQGRWSKGQRAPEQRVCWHWQAELCYWRGLALGPYLWRWQCQRCRPEAARLRLAIVRRIACWVIAKQVQVHEFTDPTADIIRKLLAIARDLDRLVLVPRILDVVDLREVQISEPEPFHVEGPSEAVEDVALGLGAAHPGHHLGVALEAAA
mmetsp:Transcript_1184/g.2065  ORF Transcript_1184/g.2065 Transcript_1184/m.2065 type:complete len:219 (-) Transcript_1184:431-1087(-)